MLYEAAKAAHGSGSAAVGGPSALLNVLLLASAGSKEESLQICFEALAAKLVQVLVIALEEANANVLVLELLSSGSLMALAEFIVNKSQV